MTTTETYSGSHRSPILECIAEPLERFSNHQHYAAACRYVYGVFVTAGRKAAEETVERLVILFEDAVLNSKVTETTGLMSR